MTHVARHFDTVCYVYYCCSLKIMSEHIMDDWKLKIRPVVRLERPTKRFVDFIIFTCVICILQTISQSVNQQHISTVPITSSVRSLWTLSLSVGSTTATQSLPMYDIYLRQLQGVLNVATWLIICNHISSYAHSIGCQSDSSWNIHCSCCSSAVWHPFFCQL